MTPEGKVKKIIKMLLDSKSSRLYYNMPVPSGYGKSTLDFIGCYYGWFFAVEAKAPGHHPSLRQVGIIAELDAAGAAVFVIDGSNRSLDALAAWLTEIERLSM